MIDLREYFYNKIKNEMDHWDMSDACLLYTSRCV